MKGFNRNSNIRTSIYHLLVIILWQHKIQMSSHTHNMTDECIRWIEEIAFSTIETSGEMRRMEVTEKQSSKIFLSCLYSARRSDGRKFFNHPQYLYVGLKNILIFCICRSIHYTTILHLTILIFQICRMLIKLKSCLLMQ